MGEAVRRRVALPGDVKGTFADKLTLDEIAANDLEMTKDAVKNASKYRFGKDIKKAVTFVRLAVDATLKRLGIIVNVPTSPEMKVVYAAVMDKQMREKQIRIEHRNHYKGAETWRCGIYIYQRDELVAFVSDVLTERRTEADRVTMKVGRDETGFMVITNAQMEDTKRIFLLH
jgi:hypothetical protein